MTNAYIALALGLVLYFILLRPLFAKRIERKVGSACRNAGRRLLAEPLMETVRAGDVQRIKAVLKHCKIDPNMVDEQGNTALRYAVEGRNPEIAYLFLTAGAKTDTTFPDGATALSLARGNDELTTLLERFGAQDPNKSEPEPSSDMGA